MLNFFIYERLEKKIQPKNSTTIRFFDNFFFSQAKINTAIKKERENKYLRH